MAVPVESEGLIEPDLPSLFYLTHGCWWLSHRRSSQKGRTPRAIGDREQRPLIQVECPEQEEGEEEERPTAPERRRRVVRGGSRSRERSGKRDDEREEEEADNIEEGYQSDSETSDDDDDDDDTIPFMRNNDLYVGG